MTNKHPFHIVDLSPWPLINSINLFNVVFLSLTFFKTPNNTNLIIFITAIRSLIFTSFLWWRDICREGCYQGHHTYKVYKGIKIRIIIFICREIIFFFRFFWAYFHFCLSPEFEIRNTWPPVGIAIVNPYHLPLLNRILLIRSGASVTWCHFSVLRKSYWKSLIRITITILLGIFFRIIQAVEYINITFSINDNVFGSVFYMLTGFHGTHVLIGTIFLSVNYFRIKNRQINNKHHFSLEAAAWYWHFVDVVWIYLYIFVYWWWF